MKTVNIRKLIITAGITGLSMLSVTAFAQSAKPVTLKGEVLDMSCYMAKGAHGPSHKSCAEMCVAAGAPIGLLTSSGDVYLLVEDHDKPSPYAEARKHAGDQIEVTGMVADRGGVRGLVVNDMKPGM